MLTLASGPGCGRPALEPGSPDDAGGGPGLDAGEDLGTGADTADAPRAVDTADAPGAADAVDASDGPAVQPLPCNVLRTVSMFGPVTPRHARKVLFSPDRFLFVLHATAANPPPGSAATDDLLLVRLPIAHPETLASGIRDVEWLGKTGRLLATMASGGGLVVVSLDGSTPRTIAGGSCAHLTAPDGGRVLVLRDCDSGGHGALDEVDVATGAVIPRAPLVWKEGSLAFSPSGRFAAYVAAASPDAGFGEGGVLHVLDGGKDQTLSQRPAGAPYFVSDQVLLFVSGAPVYGVTDAHVHVPGSGATSRRIAQSRHYGFQGYRVSPDGSLLLAASWSNTPPFDDPLYAVGLDGGGERLLTSKLYPYQLNQVGLTPFAFTASGRRVIYAGGQTSMGGIYAAPLDGSPGSRLADGYGFIVSPFAERLAAIDMNVSTNSSTVRILDLAMGGDVFAFQAPLETLIRAPTFVPGDRGLLFIESPMTGVGSMSLNHLSFADARTTPLGRWNRSQLPIAGYPVGDVAPGYPWVDPTGCFTIVDSDLPDAAGTSLVVLPDAPD